MWIRFVAEELSKATKPLNTTDSLTKYRLSRKDLEKAQTIIKLSIEAKVSPLRVNQGIWYFASNVVSDSERLKKLIQIGDTAELSAELALMEGFLPVIRGIG